MNQLQLSGRAVSEGELSHTAHGIPYYRFLLSAERLSGHNDILRILVSEKALRGHRPAEGVMVRLEGQIRSYNNNGGNGNRLLISALVGDIEFGGDYEPCNRVCLDGTLCRAPGYRRTPLGREICDIMLAVPRVYGRNDYIPLITWGQCARTCSQLTTGDPLRVEGRFQSRNYTKVLENGTEERTAFEVSVTKLLNSEDGSVKS